MSPKDHNDWRKTDRAKDKIKEQKKKNNKHQKKHWSEWAGDNLSHPDDSVDMSQQEWENFLEGNSDDK
tara:strand:+ start:1963 stop:2166 length:204 start_codon:yes stop_codon:yes gene_type:complete